MIGLILGIVGINREPAGRGTAIAGIVINAVILVDWDILGAIIILGLGSCRRP